jgi:hypothetical protein
MGLPGVLRDASLRRHAGLLQDSALASS